MLELYTSGTKMKSSFTVAFIPFFIIISILSLTLMVQLQSCSAAFLSYRHGKYYNDVSFLIPRKTKDIIVLHNFKPRSNDQNDNDDIDNDDNDHKQNQMKLIEKIDDFLDTQFFHPDEIISNNDEYLYNKRKNVESKESNSVNENKNPVLWFARLVKDDYQTAEAFYAAVFISILVILTQELLRMVKYGDAYVPFTKIGSGSLF